MHHASTYMYFKYYVRNCWFYRWSACELSSLIGVFVSYCCYLSHNNIFTCTVWFPVAHIKEKISKVISALHNQFLEQFQWFCIDNWFIISKDILVLFLSILYTSHRETLRNCLAMLSSGFGFIFSRSLMWSCHANINKNNVVSCRNGYVVSVLSLSKPLYVINKSLIHFNVPVQDCINDYIIIIFSYT